MTENKVYIAIDLKSFYASVECADRGFDPLTTHLVVADETRTSKTICLAVTPSLKAYGISGRARLWEVEDAVIQINNKRFQDALRTGALPKNEDGTHRFVSESFYADALAADPSLKLSFIIAQPRMKLYEEISTKIFSIYMRYVSAEDILVYSIDECFIDVTGYLNIYHMTAHELAMTIIREVLYETRMGDIARLSMTDGNLLYKALGVKAEAFIDHAWGWEPVEIPAIKAYKPASNSISSGQVLKEPYDSTLARLIVREMAELLALDLVRKRVATKKITLTIGYDRTSLTTVYPNWSLTN